MTTRGNALEDRLQLLIEAVVDYGIFVLEPDGTIASWNTGARKLKGYTRDEVVGRHFSLFYPQEAIDSGWPQEELRRAAADGRFEDEGWRIRKDGSRFWANVIITALRDNGELVGFAKVTRDLTERKSQEAALSSSEERFRLLVDRVRDYAIFMLDPAGLVQSWNAGAQAIKGYAATEIIGRHFSTFYPREDVARDKPANELAAARELGRVEDDGWRVRKDGTLFWANVVITALYNDGGELIGFAKVTRDMTERRRLDELERSSRRMNEFLAMLAHELRNPLAPIRNAVTLMQLEPLPTPALRNARDIIDRQLSHIGHLVDDLLDVGRLNTGKITLRRKVVALQDLIGQSIETVRPVAAGRMQQLDVEIEDAATDAWLDCDPTRIVQALQNVLVNASRYTPEQGSIRLKAVRIDGHLELSVHDTGRGIAAQELEAIFGLFAQGSTRGPNETGLGIGLTLARSLVEMHGGTLQAASPGLGLGSTFTLRLPVAMRPGASTPGEREFGELARILVVDDNRDAAESLGEVMRALGHEVQCAFDGTSGIACARDFQPHVVLLDIAMPGLSGYETLAGMREVEGLAESFYVALTGYGGGDERAKSKDAGFDAHITKPAELDPLIELLAEAVARAKIRRKHGGRGSAPGQTLMLQRLPESAEPARQGQAGQQPR